jgi:hypothetical protein
MVHNVITAVCIANCYNNKNNTIIISIEVVFTLFFVIISVLFLFVLFCRICVLYTFKRTCWFLSITSLELLRSVGWFDTDVSGLRILPNFKGQAVKAFLRTALPLNMGLMCSSETSVSNHLTQLNNTESGRFLINRVWSKMCWWLTPCC